MADNSDSLEVTEEQRIQMARMMAKGLRSENLEERRAWQRAAKITNPNATFVDMEIDERFAKQKEELAEERRKRDEAERVARANAEYEATRNRVTERGFKIEDVEKVMKDKGIANYDTAMEFLEAQQQLAPPTPDSLGLSMEMPSQTAEINKNPKRWALNEGYAAVNELIRARKRA